VTSSTRAATTGALLALAALATIAHAQQPPRDVGTLVRQLESHDFEQASAAVDALRRRTDARPAVVAGLIGALATGTWDRCGGDVRDAIASALLDLKAREAVLPLLELVRSGRPIEHECSE
jgi:HEAT repeat protein